MALGFGPISVLPISAIRHAIVTETFTTTVRFATRSFPTRPTDSPANENIKGRINAGLRLSRRINIVDGQFGPHIETDFGEVELNNEDGQLDYLVDQYAADGRQVRLYIGSTEIDGEGNEQVQPFLQFAKVYTTVAGWWQSEFQVVRLRLQSLNATVNDVLQQQRYSGVGDKTGTPEMAGMTKPVTFGHANNVTLQLVDPLFQTYQAHAGAMEEFIAVYDMGQSIPFMGEFSTYEDMVAVDMSPQTSGQRFAACPNEGFIRLAIEPLGTVTADVRGAKDNTTGNYVATVPNLCRTILLDYGGVNTNLFDHVSFSDLAAIAPAANYFLPAGGQTPVLQVVGEIAWSMGAIIGQDRSGLFRMQLLELPGETVHWTFDGRDIMNMEKLPIPNRVPWRSWGFGYSLNWTIQTEPDLATNVSAARKQFLKNTRRHIYVQSPDISQFHPTSTGMVRESFVDDAIFAQEEAQRLLNFYGYGRSIYEVIVKNALFSVEIGQTVRLTYHRWVPAGKNFIVVSIEDSADDTTTVLQVYG